MMSTTELVQDPSVLGEEQELEYYEHLYDDMLQDTDVKIDITDFDEDMGHFWAMKQLRIHYFHYFYAFYGLLTVLLGCYDFVLSDQALSLNNVVLMLGGSALLVFSLKIYISELRHKVDYLNYRRQRILNT